MSARPQAHGTSMTVEARDAVVARLSPDGMPRCGAVYASMLGKVAEPSAEIQPGGAAWIVLPDVLLYRDDERAERHLLEAVAEAAIGFQPHTVDDVRAIAARLARPALVRSVT